MYACVILLLLGCFVQRPGSARVVYSSCNGPAINSSLSEIRYPNSGTYQDNEDCTWIINTSVPIYMSFTRFYLEPHPGCRYDYITTYVNGVSTRFCGHKLPPSWTLSSGNHILKFHSDFSLTYRGFAVMIDKDICYTGENSCGINETCSMGTGNYSCICNAGYERNETCVDIDECDRATHNCHQNSTCINTIGSFTCRCTEGFIGNGTTCIEFCPQSVNITCNSSKEICEKVDGEWKCICNAKYTGPNCERAVYSSCGGNIISALSQIKYPYSGRYENYKDCIWRINTSMPIYIQFTMFSLEMHANCRYDYVEFNPNGVVRRYCGNNLPPRWTVPSGESVLKFHSDSSVTGRGFTVFIDRDLCSTGEHSCQNTTCQMIQGVPTCTCESGFAGNGSCTAPGCTWMHNFDGRGTSEEKIGIYGDALGCATECKRRRQSNPQINGATIRKSDGMCWCETGMNGKTPSSIYNTCYLEAPVEGCTWMHNFDGRGTSEEKIGIYGDALGCATECKKRRQSNPQINGATIRKSDGMCWCETGMNGTTPSSIYNTCYLFEDGSRRWRNDSRCGVRYKLANGEVSECNPNGINPCCSPHNWCGSTLSHCQCVGCRDYRILGPPLVRGNIKFTKPVYGQENGIYHIQGHIEILHNGIWGTICDDSFNDNSAKVLCKMSGYRGGTYRYSYRQPLAPKSSQIWLDDVVCTGKELNVEQCRHNDWGTHNCGHHEDVGIRCHQKDPCFTDGEPVCPSNTTCNAQGDAHVCSCGSGFEGNGTRCRDIDECDTQTHNCHEKANCTNTIGSFNCECVEGYGGNGTDCIELCPQHEIAKCHSQNETCMKVEGNWTCVCSRGYIGRNCEPVRIRFPNGIRGQDNGEYYIKGHVEILHNGTWGTICDDRFSDNSAKVICRMAGYRDGAFNANSYKQRSATKASKIWIENVVCNGRERNIEQCRHSPWGTHDCSHIEDVGVRCHTACPEYNVDYYGYDIRLHKGVRLWTHCGDLCKALPACQVWTWNRRNLNCYLKDSDVGRESNSHAISGSQSCGTNACWNVIKPGCVLGYSLFKYRSKTVDECKELCLRHDNCLAFEYGIAHGGRFTSNRPGDCGLKSSASSSNCDGRVRNLDLYVKKACTSVMPVSVRFPNAVRGQENGKSYIQGHVEILYNDIWGTICDDSFNDKSATVICKMGGYKDGVYNNGRYKQSSATKASKIWLDDVVCNGRESNVAQCRHKAWGHNDCSKSEDVGIRCYTAINSRIMFPNAVRGQQDGNSYIQGHVEILHDGVWGTICDDEFNDNSARVICRMGGYTTGVYNGGQYKQPLATKSAKIWIDNLRCNGDESSVEHCRNFRWGHHNCNHREDVGIRCVTVVRSVRFPNGILGAENGIPYIQGHVEILRNRIWGTICDDDFNDNSAQVLCRMAGYQYGVYDGGKYKQSTATKSSKIWLDDVRCNGRERDVDDCTHSSWGSNNCNHDEDVGIRCSSVVRTIMFPNALRGQENGLPYIQGHVEILHDGTWGMICDDDFNDNGARVLCRMAGYDNGVYRGGQFRQPSTRKSRKMWLDNVVCNGEETNVADCRHSPWGQHNCGAHEAIGIRCYTAVARPVRFPNGVRGQVNGIPYIQGHVEILRNRIWGTICDDHFNDNSAKVLCRMAGYQYGVYDGGQYKQSGATKSSKIWLDDVRCNGEERDVDDCRHNSWGSNDCSHREDVGIRCSGGIIRTVMFLSGLRGQENGVTYIQGHVEILHDDTWGTICDDDFNDNGARVLCRMAGYDNGVYRGGQFKQESIRKSPKMWLDNVVCNGEERNIADCTHNAWGEHDCGANEAIGIRCYTGRVPTTSSSRIGVIVGPIIAIIIVVAVISFVYVRKRAMRIERVRASGPSVPSAPSVTYNAERTVAVIHEGDQPVQARDLPIPPVDSGLTNISDAPPNYYSLPERGVNHGFEPGVNPGFEYETLPDIPPPTYEYATYEPK